jgi:hypothetical protein
MHSAVKPEFRRDLESRRSDAGLPGTDNDPVLAITYRMAEAIMDIAGPLFWAVLVLAFMTSALGIDLPQ